MINYEEELKKFKPCLEVNEVEETIHSQELTDIMDIVKEMMDSRSAGIRQ